MSDKVQQQLVNVITGLNPAHIEYAGEWALYRDAYEGDPNQIKKRLHKHTREADDVYQERQNRAYYVNYVEAIVDLWVSYIFRFAPKIEPPKDVAGREDVVAFLNDADRCGHDFPWVLKSAAKEAQVYGFCGVLVDAPTWDGDEANKTEAQRVAEKIFPYARTYRPQDITDWSVDADDHLQWVRLREVIDPRRGPLEARKSELVERYRTWTATEWMVHEVVTVMDARGNPISGKSNVTLVAGKAHPLGRVPFTLVYAGKNREGVIAQSPVRAISQINMMILNLCSLMDEELYNKTLSILAMPQGSPGTEIVIGSRNVLEYDASSGQKPEYLAPPAEPLDNMMQLWDRAERTMYRLARMGSITKLQETGEIGSGVALKQEFLETNQALKEKADELELAAADIMDSVCRWAGRDDGFKGDDARVDFADDFGVADFMADLEEIMEIHGEIHSETARRLAEKQFCSRYFANVSQEDTQKMHDEINAHDYAPPVVVSAETSPDAADVFGKGGKGQKPPVGQKPQPGGAGDEAA